ncbi:PepSY1/2 domain-containing protein [Halanaerobacter jeridensis]|uniref:Spore germination protein n=1 Tax=Halanaerobacter jeridensis TaxID=706427 RepID=A0A938XV05_9FIRM|nr:spore germination protein [Halanaerobacter jeridensis]
MNFKNFNKRLWGIVFLALALIAVGYWGYSRYMISRQLRSELNNRYEYAFQELNHHIDALESELGVLLISQSASNASINLSNVWRSAYAAQEDIGQLPLTSDTLNNVKYLLADVLKYANHLDRKITGENLTEEEKNMINKFYNQICVVNTNLQDIHSEMDKEKFKWYDKKRVKINERNEDYSASPMQGLMKLDNKVTLDRLKSSLETVMPNYNKSQSQDVISSLSKVEAVAVNEKEAIKITKDFIKNPENYNYEIREKKGLKLKAAQEAKVKVPAYEVKAVHKNNPDEIIYADVSKKGGRIVWLLKKRELGDKKIDYEEAESNALKFVEKNKYPNMEVSSRHSFDEFLIVSLLPKQNNVLIKPNSVIAEVALDNGEIVGFNGLDYILNYKERSEDELMPDLKQSEAKSKISSRLELVKDPQLVIDQIDGQEKLCYEFIGVIKDGERQNHYRVKINAKTGREEEVKATTQQIYRKTD